MIARCSNIERLALPVSSDVAYTRGTLQDGFGGQLFLFYFLKTFLCYVIAIFDLMHDMEAIHGLC